MQSQQPPQIEEFHKPADEWENYGDVNPERHGGRFVKFDENTGNWRIVRTIMWADVCADAPDECEAQMVDEFEIYPSEVFVDGEPKNGLTDAMKSILESLGDENLDPDNYPDEETEYAPDFVDRYAYYLADMIHYVRSVRGDTHKGDYADILDEYGVDYPLEE